MVDLNVKLSVLHNTGSSDFIDHSLDALDFKRDTFSLSLEETSYLYVGYKKPFNSIYVALNTANTVSNEFTYEYYNGSTWTELTNFYDDTKGFTRSGFLSWDRNQANEYPVEVNGSSNYWIRLKPSANHSATIIQGINFLFCDDIDLLTEVPEILDQNLLAGKSNHLLTHVAVRNQILQELNNKDLKKNNPVTGLREDLNFWDVLNANQMKQAAMYLALSKIFFNLSDGLDDKWLQKSNYFQSKYKDALNLSLLSLDKDDDGIEDDFEKVAETFSVHRIRR